MECRARTVGDGRGTRSLVVVMVEFWLAEKVGPVWPVVHKGLVPGRCTGSARVKSSEPGVRAIRIDDGKPTPLSKDV